MRADLHRRNELGVFAVVAETATHVLVEAADEVLQGPGERIVVAEPVAVAGVPRRASRVVRLAPAAAVTTVGGGRRAIGVLNGGATAAAVRTDAVRFVVVVIVVEELAPFVAVERGQRRVVAQLGHVTALRLRRVAFVSPHRLPTAAAAAAGAESQSRSEVPAAVCSVRETTHDAADGAGSQRAHCAARVTLHTDTRYPIICRRRRACGIQSINESMISFQKPTHNTEIDR